ncbi:MAG: hypothetical protein IJT09_03870 [Abditibacteriota bacterium]|nr:hypothetical protein [Abditibacteriota bacterium]
MAVYYVSPTGSDKSGTGTKENPFASVKGADESRLLTAGDVVLLAPGEYDIVCKYTSGVTYRADGDVKIVSAEVGTTDHPLSYITLEGFTFVGTPVNFAGSPQGCAVKNCVFDTKEGKVCAAFNRGDGCLFEGNTVTPSGDTDALCSVCTPGRVTVRDNEVKGGDLKDIRYEYTHTRYNHFPNTKNYTVLQGDFHLHTSEGSDGCGTLRERFEEAKLNGWDVIAITDHGNCVVSRNYVAEQREAAAELSEETGVIYLKGFETGFGYDPLNYREHLVAVDIPGSPVSYDHRLTEDGGEHDYMKRLEEINKEGGFVIWAHPDSDYAGIELADELGRTPTKKAVEAGLIKGIEVVNGAVGYNPVGYWGDRYEKDAGPRGASVYTRTFDYALKHNLTIFANNDAHQAMVPCYTLVLAKERTAKGIREALDAGRTAAYFEDILWAKPEVMAELTETMISARRYPAVPEWKDHEKIALTNNSPMMLLPEIDGKVYAIRPGETARIFVHPAETVKVRWTNLFVSSKDCFETAYPPKAATENKLTVLRAEGAKEDVAAFMSYMVSFLREDSDSEPGKERFFLIGASSVSFFLEIEGKEYILPGFDALRLLVDKGGTLKVKYLNITADGEPYEAEYPVKEEPKGDSAKVRIFGDDKDLDKLLRNSVYFSRQQRDMDRFFETAADISRESKGAVDVVTIRNRVPFNLPVKVGDESMTLEPFKTLTFEVPRGKELRIKWTSLYPGCCEPYETCL